jgi:Protein of unknown function (DUF3435)
VNRCYIISADGITQYITGPLTQMFELSVLGQPKPTFMVEDLLAVLRYHWCQDTAILPHGRYALQLPLLMLLMAYTSSRPGALVEGDYVRDTNEALCYKDVVLRVLPNPDDPHRNILAMEVTLRYMKGHRGDSR